MNKFKNVNELDKRISYLDKELAAANAGGDAYQKFSGIKGKLSQSKISPFL